MGESLQRYRAFSPHLICAGLALLCAILLAAGCTKAQVEDQQVSLGTAQAQQQVVEAALPAVEASALMDNPVIAAALAAPQAGAQEEWEAKYEFPAAGSVEAGG